jgi:hypothetical protein
MENNDNKPAKPVRGLDDIRADMAKINVALERPGLSEEDREDLRDATHSLVQESLWLDDV